MRSREQILAEVLDSLIRRGDGRTPSEIAPLSEVATRLHNECPDPDPTFLQRLQARLQAEWSPPGRAQLLRATLAGLLPRPSPRLLLRGAAGALVGVLLLLALAAQGTGLRSAQAGLGRTITIFRQARVEQWPAQPVTPARPLQASRSFASIEEAQAAASFPLRVPSYLPGGLTLLSIRAIDTPGGDKVLLHYANPDAGVGPGRASVLVLEYRLDGAPAQASLTLPADLESVERLQVAGRKALWMPRQRSSIPPRMEDGYDLLVEDGEVLIEIYGTVGREESVRIVESMLR